MNPLQQAVQSRGIDFLVHFTRLDNLHSIMNHGLIPRSQLESEGFEVTFNDSERIDDCLNATCLSINFPNYKMFWACRQSFKEVQWVVLATNSIVLWEKDCAFCQENAASNAVTCIPLPARQGVDAFNRLYEEIDGKPSRKELRIPDRAPTNPQAEVLVFDIIEPELIVGVLVENRVVGNEIKKRYSTISSQILPDIFRPRKDYEHWK